MDRLKLISEQISQKEKPFAGKTIVITGASRGIGLAIARACAKDGANIAILAKTVEENPKLPGTIYTAAK
jgi:citronellol/citronellal dehydrogenase